MCFEVLRSFALPVLACMETLCSANIAMKKHSTSNTCLVRNSNRCSDACRNVLQPVHPLLMLADTCKQLTQSLYFALLHAKGENCIVIDVK
jgi:hypothetical protein